MADRPQVKPGDQVFVPWVSTRSSVSSPRSTGHRRGGSFSSRSPFTVRPARLSMSQQSRFPRMRSGSPLPPDAASQPPCGQRLACMSAISCLKPEDRVRVVSCQGRTHTLTSLTRTLGPSWPRHVEATRQAPRSRLGRWEGGRPLPTLASGRRAPGSPLGCAAQPHPGRLQRPRTPGGRVHRLPKRRLHARSQRHNRSLFASKVGLSPDARQRTLRYVIPKCAGYCHRAGSIWVLELAVRAGLTHLLPTLPLEYPNHFANLHWADGMCRLYQPDPSA
jgi:hypothetical protein